MAARHASELDLLRFDDRFDGEIRLNEPLSKHTTYRIGGPAKIYASVNSVSALTRMLDLAEREDISWCVVGKGSNLLVADEGFPGMVVVLGGEFREWRFDDQTNRVTVGAGTILSRLVQEAFHRGYAGMEFAVGTPGTVGGALCMNAGTKDDWIGSRVRWVTTYQPGVGLRQHMASEISWGVRETSFAPDEIILECELQLSRAYSGNIDGRMKSLLDRRKATQPLEYPSCGSVFRNPEGQSAGELLESSGLKGKRIGGAQVSEKHANFIINTGNATAKNVRELIDLAKTEVSERYGIELTTEVRFLGFQDQD